VKPGAPQQTDWLKPSEPPNAYLRSRGGSAHKMPEEVEIL
jgi:hypothetical protein